jgi:AraC family transcriptional regulator, exoenzyme S synthesis regulatory protein ExsA
MYELDAVKVLLANENNSILYKRLDSNMLNMEKIIVSHSIVYIKSGTVEIETYDYKKFTATQGEMLFMPRDSYLISDYIKERHEMEVYLFFFDHSFTSEFLQNNTVKKDSTENRILKLNVSDNILHYIGSLQKMKYQNRNNNHLLKIKIFELLHLVCESNEHFIATLRSQEDVKADIETYMLEHYDKNLSASDWAMLSGYSLSTFNRKFKKKYNISPKKWIIQQNMKLANEALKKGASVSSCASEFGYSNASNFIKAFKEIYKITPKQYSMT